MKKLTVICLDCEKNAAVRQMQALGTLHVLPARPTALPSDESLTVRQRLEALDAALAVLTPLAPQSAAVPSMTSDAPADSEALLAYVTDLMTQRRAAAEDEAAAERDLGLLAPWGSFDRTLLETVRNAGLTVELGTCPPKKLDELRTHADQSGAVVRVLHTGPARVALAVVSDTPVQLAGLSPAVLPECTDRAALTARRNDARERRNALTARLAEAATGIGKLEALRETAEDTLRFTAARDTMGHERQLAFLTGYLPETGLEAFLSCARTAGWAVRHEDIAPDDPDVPTLLKLPKRFAMAKSIFDIVGILPGYFEADVSVSVYLFLSLFCGMLIGDAGYGAILTAVSLIALGRAREAASRNGLKVLLTMSCCTLVFGALSANWFGIPVSSLPVWMRGLSWLSEDLSQNHIKLLCFFVGAAHMSLAHLWAAVREKHAVRAVLGNIGWTVFLWANFFAAAQLIAGGIPGTDTLMKGLYGVGAVLILLFSINWRNLGDVIYSPFSFINSFVDILSYIRLFAVGLSGVYIAGSFNDMGHAIWHAGPWFAPFAVLVLFLGHLLNIAMAALSILVHGVRLNTLEFSGHIGLTWSGKPYRPLRQTSSAHGKAELA